MDPVAAALDKVSDHILENFCPSATTLLAVRRFNACMAILCKRLNLVVTDAGIIYSAPDTKGPSAVEEDPEPA